jgi:CrcB protein
MNLVIAIAIGGGVGSLLRYFLSSIVYQATGDHFPWGILIVNILGGFAMGLIVELGAQRLAYSPEVRAFLVTGVLGGFTTFSAFSLDTALMIERGDWGAAAAYIGLSVVLSIGALFAALWLVRTAL